MEKELLPTYAETLTPRIHELRETLTQALQDFEDLDLAASAKSFRKLAQDLKLAEFLITDKGKHSEKNSLNDLTGKQWLQHTKSWIVVDGKREQISKEIKNHPASYPPSLAEYYISYFSKKDGWVCDPFLGVGSTAAACEATNRNCFGIELNPEYCAYAKGRVTPKEGQQFMIVNGDSRNIEQEWKKAQIPKINFVITSPPYWNMLQKSRGGVKSAQKKRKEEGLDTIYSDSAEDLGNIEDYQAYLQELCDLFTNLKPILHERAHLMVILQNCRIKSGEMRPIAWDFAQLMAQEFKLLQEFIWLQDQKFMGIWGWPTTYVSNVHHHYCLVFKLK